MDPNAPAVVGRAASKAPSEAEASIPPTDPTCPPRPPSPGLGSIYSRATHTSLAAFDAREALRRRRWQACMGISAAATLLGSLLLFFLFPRPPTVTAATPTYVLTGPPPTPASFSAVFTLAVTVDNSASWAPFGLRDIQIRAFSPYSNAPMVSASAGAPITAPARAVKDFTFSLGVSTLSGAPTAAATNQVALLSCAAAILDGSGCAARLRVTGTPTYLGFALAPRSFDASVVLK